MDGAGGSAQLPGPLPGEPQVLAPSCLWLRRRVPACHHTWTLWEELPSVFTGGRPRVGGRRVHSDGDGVEKISPGGIFPLLLPKAPFAHPKCMLNAPPGGCIALMQSLSREMT